MKEKMKSFITKIIYKVIFNYRRPRYNGFVYNLANKYVSYYRGDENGDMETNGESRFLKELIFNKKIEVVFDVGANIGDWSEIVTNLNKNLEIHCFEPDKEVFEKLKSRFLDNEKIKVNNFAVSDVVGQKNFYKNHDSPELNSFYNMKEKSSSVYENATSIPVSVISIDDYCTKNNINHIDLLKIDVEGHELSVLKGATKMFQKTGINLVQFEFGFASKYARVFFKDFVEFFEQFGYDLYKLKPLANEVVQYKPELEQTPYANFIASRRNL